jgi:hypothetical protein
MRLVVEVPPAGGAQTDRFERLTHQPLGAVPIFPRLRLYRKLLTTPEPIVWGQETIADPIVRARTAAFAPQPLDGLGYDCAIYGLSCLLEACRLVQGLDTNDETNAEERCSNNTPDATEY